MTRYEEYVTAWRQARQAWFVCQADVPDAGPADDPGDLLTEEEYQHLMALADDPDVVHDDTGALPHWP